MQGYLNKKINLTELYPIIENQLKNGGNASFTVHGTSMQPMLTDRKDTVIIVKSAFPLKKYDIIFYRRENGQFVLHRIIKVKKDGYVCRGDHQTVKEYPVTENMVIGVLSEFTHKGKQRQVDRLSHRFYSFIYVHTAFLRYYARTILGVFR
ncbi:MAG TPA: hypothetical protein DCP51_08255 [Clostridiales bacterium]|nr:hypothetical protein [Clostridiales bacterium]